jgi:2-C-methyl-D-erythritol 4-phosphate cytidylyltransferase
VTVAAVVAAGGRGIRLGSDRPKALVSVGGVPLLVHAVAALARAKDVALVVVAAPPEAIDDCRALLGESVDGCAVLVVAGGATRSESVRAGLAALPSEVDVVLVHDAARGLAPSGLADAVVAAVRAGADAVVPGVAVADTVKQVDQVGRVVATPDRDALRAVQTPQGFRRSVLDRAHEVSDAEATDDASLVERLGVPVVVVAGHDDAFKVTSARDLELAEAVLAARSSTGAR